MPTAALKACLTPGCPGIAPARESRCPSCQAKRPARVDPRPPSYQRGYNDKWRIIRASFLKRHPHCNLCGHPAQQVDHIITLANGGSHKDTNLQALCGSCHSRKTVQQDGGFRLRPSA